MGSTQFGNFHDFCRDSTLPVCNLFVDDGESFSEKFGGCDLTGIPLSGEDSHLRNLGSIILCGAAIAMSTFLIWMTDKKKAAVGRREMQLFLAGFVVIQICEIFTVGGFPLDDTVRKAFSAVHLAAIAATSWLLLLNSAVGFQLLDDGTIVSIGLCLASALLIFVGTGYIALDTAFQWTGHFDSSLDGDNQNIGLYVLYLLFPLVCLVAFVVLESVLVLHVLQEIRPMAYIGGAALLFAIGQIFQYVVSTHICQGTNGAIDGALFETLFTLLSVGFLWTFWSSITEDDWDAHMGSSAYT